MGRRDAEELSQLLTAAFLTRWFFVAADEEFELTITVGADEFVEGHFTFSLCT